MLSVRTKKILALFVVTLTLPVSAFGATVSETLRVSDDRGVTRGEFLRASIIVLGVPVDSSKVPVTGYTRPVPRALQQYVRTAQKYGALELFGKDLGLGKGITRGEAVLMIALLQKLQPSGVALQFSDAPKGSDLENAIQAVVEKGWMQPIRRGYFGASRMLSGREAKIFLRKVAGEDETVIEMGPGGEPKTPAVIIRFKKKETPPLPESNLLRAVWQLLNDQYLYNEKINDKEAAYKAAEALVDSVGDPYTTFLRPAVAKEFQTQIDGEVSGIGAQVEYKDNKLIIVAPLTGSPAEKAGLRAGDEILLVDNVSLAGLSLLEAVGKVRGPKGSTVMLRVRRDGVEMDIEVKRDNIKVPEIDISYQGDIAVVKLIQFGQTTDRELRSLMMDVQNKNPKGIILDLRNNPGGLLHAAEIVVSNFLPQGSGIARILSREKEYTEVTLDPPTIDADVPVVVLVNKGSASASEIVAGALQDAGRATIIGEKTFGKGTVQQIIDFYEGSSLKMTIAEWLTPKGRKINGEGVMPDIEVKQSETRDEQLLRAIDHLR